MTINSGVPRWEYRGFLVAFGVIDNVEVKLCRTFYCADGNKRETHAKGRYPTFDIGKGRFKRTYILRA